MVSVLQNLLAKGENLALNPLFILSKRQHGAMTGVSLVVAIMWFCQLPLLLCDSCLGCVSGVGAQEGW